MRLLHERWRIFSVEAESAIGGERMSTPRDAWELAGKFPSVFIGFDLYQIHQMWMSWSERVCAQWIENPTEEEVREAVVWWMEGKW